MFRDMEERKNEWEKVKEGEKRKVRVGERNWNRRKRFGVWERENKYRKTLLALREGKKEQK